jgi:phospholipid transport system substrate-binding protein
MYLRDVSVHVFASVLLIAASATHASAANSRSNSADPSHFIKNLADQAIQVLSTPNGSLQQREDKFRELLRDDFAMDKIGRFVVGGYWRKMDEAQRAKYQKLFSQWVLKTYSVRLGGYSGESFRVIRTTDAGRRDVIVHTRIERQGGNGFDANWRVRRVDDRLKIIDIYVEGISMAVTQRSEFESILRKHGIDGLLSRLQDRLAQLSEAS